MDEKKKIGLVDVVFCFDCRASIQRYMTSGEKMISKSLWNKLVQK